MCGALGVAPDSQLSSSLDGSDPMNPRELLPVLLINMQYQALQGLGAVRTTRQASHLSSRRHAYVNKPYLFKETSMHTMIHVPIYFALIKNPDNHTIVQHDWHDEDSLLPERQSVSMFNVTTCQAAIVTTSSHHQTTGMKLLRHHSENGS